MPVGADVTKFTPADFNRYGLPYLGSMPLKKWHALVDGTHHVCGRGKPSHYEYKLPTPRIHSSGTELGVSSTNSLWDSLARLGLPTLASQVYAPYVSYNWEGNVADSSSGPYTEANLYTEADSVFYVPAVPTVKYGTTGIWPGVGGVDGTGCQNQNLGTGLPCLTQAGVGFGYDPNTGVLQWFPWVENLGATGSQGDQGCSGFYACVLDPNSYPLSSGDRIQVIVTQNQMYVGSSRGWRNTWTYGPYPDHSTAEWIVEMTDGGPLDGYGSSGTPIVTFYGMGDTQTNGTYTGPYWQNHDYFVLHYSNNDILCTLGPLEYNTTWGPPNDSNTIYFKQSS